MSHLLLTPFKVRLLLIVTLFIAFSLAVSFGAIPSTKEAKEPDPSSYLLREGTKLEAATGFFQPAGDRTIFFMKTDRRRFICLENLALQRIDTQSAKAEWRVQGTVTEFNGENYLLIEMAVMTSVD
ncbi:MAG: hypothetical protein PVH19_14970 [Planctomycetia bacterium]|jgi:hypothetical protein